MLRTERLRALPCAHIFHTLCINKWMQMPNNRSKRCPECQTEHRDYNATTSERPEEAAAGNGEPAAEAPDAVETSDEPAVGTVSSATNTDGDRISNNIQAEIDELHRRIRVLQQQLRAHQLAVQTAVGAAATDTDPTSTDSDPDRLIRDEMHDMMNELDKLKRSR